MARTECIRNAENNSISHLASAARQSASVSTQSSLPFRGMDGQRDPQLVKAAQTVHGIYPRAEWIRVKHLSNGRIIITIKATGIKVCAKGYGITNAQNNLIYTVAKSPKLWQAMRS